MAGKTPKARMPTRADAVLSTQKRIEDLEKRVDSMSSGVTPGAISRWKSAVLTLGKEWRTMPMGRAVERMDFDEDQQRDFCHELSQHGNYSRACVEVGTIKKVVKRLEKLCPEFAAQVQFAKELFCARLEDAAIFRAIEGERTEHYRNGQLVSVTYKTSDALLQTLLKANNPEKYGDKVKVDASTGGVLVLPMQAPPTTEEWMEQNEQRQLAEGTQPTIIDTHEETKTNDE